MRLSKSRAKDGGGALIARALGTVASATVLALSTGTALAGADEQPAGPPAKATVKVTVIGDSFTSGEGANAATYRTAPVTTTDESGITYQVDTVDPAHQSSTAPTLQAINQIKAANPNADIQVTFVPVSGATRDSLYQTTNPGTPFEQPPQINAVKGADVVIVGIGGNDARFSQWVSTVLFNADGTSAQQFPQFMQPLNDGTYVANQIKLLNDVATMAAPDATIVSLGYPKAMPDTIPGTPTWWSPFSWSTISQEEANRSNQLAAALNADNQDASLTAASQHPGQQWLFGDVSTALQGHELFTNQEGLNGLTPSNTAGSYHPNDLGQQLLGSVLQPYVEQAVNNQLAKQGVTGAENVAPITPTFSYEWNLRVDVPLQAANQPPWNTPQPPAQAPAPTQAPSDQPAEQDKTQPDATGQTEPTRPDTAQPEGVQPEAPQPDGSQPDAVQPGGSQPDAMQPDGVRPDGTQPGEAQPGAVASDAVQPDAVQPDAVQPDEVQADAAQPEVAPGVVQPEVAQPEVAQPGGSQPDAVQPGGSQPEVAQPEVAQQDTSAADMPAAPAEPQPALPPADAPSAPEPTDAPPSVPPVDAPVAIAPEPAPVAPDPVVVQEPAPIVDAVPEPIAPPPPVITPVEPPSVAPVNPVDTGLSSGTGLDSADTGLDSADTGLSSVDTGLGSDAGIGSSGSDAGGFSGDSGGGGGE